MKAISIGTMILCCPLLAALTFAASDQDLFRGLDDSAVISLLKELRGKTGRWNVSPEDGRFLYDLIVKHGYKRGLEIGTSNGYSSLWLGLAFRKNGGRLTTIEIDEGRFKEAGENFHRAGLTQVIDSRHNDAFREIPKLAGNFDFVFIDAGKPDYKRFLDLLYPRVPSGGAITAHNVIDLASGMEDFLDAIQHNPNLETTIEKTSAGISVSIKKK